MSTLIDKSLVATIMDEAKPDMLANMAFPKDHRAKLHSTIPVVRVNGEINWRIEVAGIFSNDEDSMSFVGAIPIEQTTGEPSSAPSISRWKPSAR